MICMFTAIIPKTYFYMWLFLVLKENLFGKDVPGGPQLTKCATECIQLSWCVPAWCTIQRCLVFPLKCECFFCFCLFVLDGRMDGALKHGATTDDSFIKVITMVVFLLLFLQLNYLVQGLSYYPFTNMKPKGLQCTVKITVL